MRKLSYEVKKLYDEVYDYTSKYNLNIGIIKNKKLPAVSLEDVKKNGEFAKKVLQKIDMLECENLDHYDRVYLEILRFWANYNFDVNIYNPVNEEFYWLHFVITPYENPFPLKNRMLSVYQINNEQDAIDYILFIEQYPEFLKQINEKFKGQMQRGIYLPKCQLEQTTNLMNSLIIDPKLNPIYLTNERLGNIDNKQYYQNKSEEILKEYNAAVQKIVDLLSSEEYKKNAPNKVGLNKYPKGKEYYDYLIKFNTTLDLTPEEIHEVGIKSTYKTEERISNLVRKVGCSSREEFEKAMKESPGFKVKKPEDVGRILNKFPNRIKPILKDYFYNTPKYECVARRLSPQEEIGITAGYYNPPLKEDPFGVYYYNASNPDVQNQILWAGAIMYHEGSPGHHLQFCLNGDDEQAQPFMKTVYLASHAEGWAEYARDLAGEMGMYKDEFEEYSSLLMEMQMCTRLVVDTGINALEWTREQAAEFMSKHTKLSDVEVDSFTIRCCSDIPAQPLSYTLGHLKFKELRKKAESELGDKFNIKDFHEVVLELGAIPLYLLEKHVDYYIMKKKQVKELT